MEVQSGFIGDKLFVRSNYAAGLPSSEAFRALLPPAAVLWTGVDTKRVYQANAINASAGTLHAEQAILIEVAKLAANSVSAPTARVVDIGTKRPCWYCRRVLKAFDTALQAHYPSIKLHYVDRTGKGPTRPSRSWTFPVWAAATRPSKHSARPMKPNSLG